MGTKKILLSEISERVQMRDRGVDPAVVNDYALAMENGEEFPDIVVFSADGKSAPYILADGNHTVDAHAKAHPPEFRIQANVRKGGMREATLYAVGANSSHGLRRTNADKRKAVSTLLKDDEWTSWSDGVIAGRASVSQPFVSSMRRELEKLVAEKPGSTQNVLSAAPTKRRGLDGVTRKTSTKTRASSSKTGVKVTDKRLFDDEGNARAPEAASPGPSPGYVEVDSKEKPIGELLEGKALVVMFQFIPKVPGVSVVVHRNDPPSASRKQIGTSEMPRLPAPVLEMIVEQLNGKGAK